LVRSPQMKAKLSFDGSLPNIKNPPERRIFSIYPIRNRRLQN